MIKKIIATICLLAVLVGAFTIVAMQANAAGGTYDVGYARVDINPYVYHYADDADAATYYNRADAADRLQDAEGRAYCVWYRDAEGNRICDIMPVPLAGTTNAWKRPSLELLDDNGDGVVDENDGLAVTCIAVTDNRDKTILMITIDSLNGGLADLVRPAVVARLNGQVSQNEIFYAGTHSHSGPNVDMRNSTPEEGYCVTADGETMTFTYTDMQHNLNVWIERTISHVADAAEAAMADRCAAVLKKDQISASASTAVGGKVMNSTRHYKGTDQNGVTYYSGDGFNDGSDIWSYKDSKDTLDLETFRGNNPKQVTQVDDTMYFLQFDFSAHNQAVPSNQRKNIVLANWRGHSSLNSSYNKYGVSADYISAFRYEVERTTNYRVAFFMDKSGNVNPAGFEIVGYSGILMWKEPILARDWIYDLADQRKVCTAAAYGTVLGQMAVEGINSTDDAVQVAGGKIVTYQDAFVAHNEDHYKVTDLEYRAAAAAKANYYSQGGSQAYTYTDPDTGEKYTIASSGHMNEILDPWNYAGNPTSLEINAICFGEGENSLAILTAPGELFDYYYKDTTLTGDARYAEANNLWNDLLNSGKYGKPMVLGYCNGSYSYFANYDAFDYPQGDIRFGRKSYEAWSGKLSQGEGEALVRKMDSMLRTMTTNANFESRDYMASCEHCGETVLWTPFVAGKTNVSGHYYLQQTESGIVETSYMRIEAGQHICLNLNGQTLMSTGRVYDSVAAEDIELNIMDTSAAQTGTIMGCGGYLGFRGSSGGVFSFGEGTTLNLYGGTITMHDREFYGVDSSGLIHMHGTFNMYGGKLTGAVVASYDDLTTQGYDKTAYGAVMNLMGTLNMYGGVIENGSFKAYQKDSAGVVTEVTVNQANVLAPCIRVASGGKINLADRVVNGKVVESVIDNVYLGSLSVTNVFKVKGNYQGSINISANGNTTMVPNQVLIYGEVDSDGQQPDVSLTQKTDGTNTFTFEGSEYTVAVDNGNLIVASDPYSYKLCEICGTKEQWKPMGESHWKALRNNGMTSGHYIMIEDATCDQVLMNYNVDNPANIDLCLDLAGYTFTGKGRAFLLRENVHMNVFDTSEDESGVINCAGGASQAAGVIYIYPDNNELVLHSGTICQTEGGSAAFGGVIYANGDFTMEGGKVIGGNAASGKGGAIYLTVNGTLTVFGGEITSGTAVAGPCIYAENGSEIYLFNDAVVEDIYFQTAAANALTLSGSFEGVAQLSFADTFTASTAVAGCMDGYDIPQGVTAADKSLRLEVVGDKLYAVVKVPVHIADINGNEVKYYSIDEALAAYTYDNTNRPYIKLIADLADSVAITEPVYMDLNGFDITGNLTVANGATLYCMDTKTDDYTVSDGDYGKVPNVSGVVAVPVNTVSGIESGYKSYRSGYLKVTEGSNVSFHRVFHPILFTGIKMDRVGIYFDTVFKGDEKVAAVVDTFGIALSVENFATDAQWVQALNATNNGAGTSCQYSVYDKTFVAGAAGNDVESTVLTNIMNGSNDTQTNAANAETQIYGRAYIKTLDGQCILGAATNDDGTDGDSFDRDTLKGLMQYVNANMWDGYAENSAVRQSVYSFCRRFANVVESWEIDKILESIPAVEVPTVPEEVE